MYLNTPYKISYDTQKFPFREIVCSILEIDNNQNLYEEILSESWFIDNQIPEFVKPKNILNFIKNKILK